MARLFVLRDLGKSYCTRLIDAVLARPQSMKTRHDSIERKKAEHGGDAPTTADNMSEECSNPAPVPSNPEGDDDDLGAAARAEQERADAALLAALRPHGVGHDLAVSMRLIRKLTRTLRANFQRPPEITNAIFLVEKAAGIVSMLNVIDSMGKKVDGDLDTHFHKLVAAASRLLSGFVTRGKRDWELPEGDIVYLCHRLIERNHPAYVNATAVGQAEIEQETFYAITGITGTRPVLDLVREALAVPFRPGAPPRGLRGRLSVLVDILKCAGIEVSVNGARGMIDRAAAKVEGE